MIITSPSIEPNFTPENDGTPQGIPSIGIGNTGLTLNFGTLRVPVDSSELRAARQRVAAASRNRRKVAGGSAYEQEKAQAAFDRAGSALKKAEAKTLDMFGVHRIPGGYKVIEARYPQLLDTWRARVAATTISDDLTDVA